MQKQKNPLNVIFGSFIQDERRKLSNLSIEEICQKGMLGMSVSLYKMTEAGNTSFNVNRIPNLIKVFKDSDLIFDRVAKLIAGQNIVDNYMSNQNMSAYDAITALADIDNEFKVLYEQTKKYFEIEEGTRQFKDYVQDVAIKEVRFFLQNNKYPMNADESFDADLINMIKDVPSLSINLLVEFIRSFSKIIPLHFDEIASNWEKDNSKDIISVDGLYLDPSLIVKKENLIKFNYEYLNQQSFTSLRFIFKTTANIDELRESFLTDLNDCRKENGLDPIDVKYSDRIHFVALPPDEMDKAHALLHDPLNTKSQFQGFWVFGTEKVEIGFIGVSEKDVNIGYNLSYSESRKRSKVFNYLYKALNINII